MAGTDERVNLLISAAVDGLKNVEGLINDLQELEKSGRVELPDNTAGLRDGLGQTSEQMQGLAERLSELRNQQGLVTQFADLKRESKELAEQQALARQRATELGKALSETENPTRAQTQEFERARKAAKDADQAWIDNQRSLNTLRGSLDEAGISTADLAGEQVRINREIEGVNQQASEMAGQLQQTKSAVEDLGDKTDETTSLMSKLGTGLKVVAAAAVGLVASISASAVAMTIFSKKQAAVADRVTNTSNAINVNREALQVWEIAFERVGGAGANVDKVLTGVTERIGRLAATGSGRAAQVFKSLNMEVEEFVRLAPDQQLIKFASAIEGLPKSEQVALLRTLGSDAEKLFPLLENNAAGLRAIAEEARQAGAIYSEEELDKLNRANDVYNEISTKLQGLTRRIGAELAPAVGDATRRVMELFDQSGSGEKLVDMFRSLIQWGEDLATSLLNNADLIRGGFVKLGQTVSFVANSVVAAFRGVQAVVSAFVELIATGFSRLLSITAGVAGALNKIGVVSDQAYSSISARADAARRVTEDLARQTDEYGRKAWEAGKRAIQSFTPVAETLKDTEEQAGKTAEAILGLAESGEAAADELEQAARQARELLGAYKDLGVTTQDELDQAADKAEAAFQVIAASGEAAQREIKEAFEAYARAVIATGDEARIRALGVVAATNGLRESLKGIKQDMAGLGQGVGAEFDESSRKIKQAADATANLKDETKAAGEEAAKAREKFLNAWGGAFAKAISNARQQVTALSAAARNLFEMKIGGNAFVQEADSASEALARATARVEELASARNRVMNNSFAAWFIDTAQAAAQTERQFWSQANALENLVGRIDEGRYSLEQLERLADNTAGQFDLLDGQRLTGLQNAIDGARQRLQSLRDESTRTLEQLQDELLQIQGQEDELSRRQQQRREDEIRARIEAARADGDQQAVRDLEESLRVLRQIGQEREVQRQAQEAQARAEEKQRQAQARQGPSQTSQAQTQPVRTVRIDLGGQQVEVLAGEETKLIRALEQARRTAM